MPYSVSEPKSLPKNVQELDETARKKWVSIFNSCHSDGKEEGDCFAIANGAVKAYKELDVVVAEKSYQYIDGWDVMDRQYSQAQAGYNPVGLSNLWAEKAEHEYPPQDVYMVPNPSNTVKEKNGAGGGSGGGIKQVVKSLFGSMIDVFSPAKEVAPRPFYTFKDVYGGTRFVAMFSNVFMDRDKQFFSTEAHKEYVDWVTKEQLYPELWLWHTKGSKWGQVDWIDFDGTFVWASGLVDKGCESIAESLAEQKEVGVSHGFFGLLLNDEVYEKYRTFEISPLPETVTSNLWTGLDFFKGESEMALSDTKKAWLKTLGVADDKIVEMETNSKELGEKLKELGLAHKETETKTEGTEKPTEEQVQEFDTQADLVKAVNGLATVVTKLVNDSKETRELAVRANKTLDDKVAEVLTAPNNGVVNGHQASTAKETVTSSEAAKANEDWFAKNVVGPIVTQVGGSQ